MSYFIIQKKCCLQDKDVVKLKVEVLAEKVHESSIVIFAELNKIREIQNL